MIHQFDATPLPSPEDARIKHRDTIAAWLIALWFVAGLALGVAVGLGTRLTV